MWPRKELMMIYKTWKKFLTIKSQESIMKLRDWEKRTKNNTFGRKLKKLKKVLDKLVATEYNKYSSLLLRNNLKQIKIWKKLLTKSERCDKIIFADNKSEMKKTKIELWKLNSWFKLYPSQLKSIKTKNWERGEKPL